MKASELRIGNIVSVYGTNGNPNSWVEIAVTAEHIKTCVSHPEWFRPIPLTEEKLINLGGKLELGDVYCFIDIYIRLNKNAGIVGGSQDDELSLDPENIKHVHQLQNLYFAIYGEELVIKKPEVSPA